MPEPEDLPTEDADEAMEELVLDDAAFDAYAAELDAAREALG